MNRSVTGTCLAFISLLSFSGAAQKCAGAPPSAEVSGDYYDWTKTLKPERPWIRDYNKTLVMKFFLCHRDNLGNVRKVYMTFADVVAVLKKMDTFTLGMPRIGYLVGWQHNGHDSKYPSWDVVNESLKRPEDATALDKRNGDPSKAGTVIITDDEVVCPVLWKPGSIVASSRSGFTDKKILLPSNWIGVKQVKLSRITTTAIEEPSALPVEHGVVRLTLEANQPMLLTAF